MSLELILSGLALAIAIIGFILALCSWTRRIRKTKTKSVIIYRDHQGDLINTIKNEESIF